MARKGSQKVCPSRAEDSAGQEGLVTELSRSRAELLPPRLDLSHGDKYREGTMTLWELRFVDGPGSSVYTTVDITGDVGRLGVAHTLPVAALTFEGSAVTDARRCFEEGDVQR